MRFYPTGGVGNFVQTTAVVPIGVWTHVAAAYEQGVGWAIYIDGALSAMGSTITGPVGTSAGAVQIGADRELGVAAGFWSGALDEVRIWSECRTGPQILSTMFVDVGRPSFTSTTYAELEAVWDMQHDSGTQVFDRASGFGKADNVASFVGGRTVIYGGGPVSPNVAIELNGFDDHAVIPMGDGFSGGVTIDAWVAPRSFTGFPTIVGRDYLTSFWLGLNGAGGLRFYPTGGGGSFIESVGTLPLDKWSHVAVTYDGTTTIFYINGSADSQSGSISGPVGENGRDPHVGADNPLSLFFNGFMDQVNITRGAKSSSQIRGNMFRGYTGFGDHFNVEVSGGMAEQWRADFDGYSPTSVHGSDARLVKSGAPLGNTSWASTTDEVHTFVSSVVGGIGTLPNDDTFSSIARLLDFPVDLAISSMKVFVSAPITNMPQSTISLRSPALKTIELMTLGHGRGRDIHTVFYDLAPRAIDAAGPPYIEHVRPSDPLSTFNGESSLGSWRLVISSATETVGLWAWGLTVNGLQVGVGGVVQPVRADLRLAGEHPVRGSGNLAFDVPAAARVDLTLFDIQGRAVRTLYSGTHPGGTTTLQWRADDLVPGVYLAALSVGGAVRKQLRVVVLR